MTNTALPNQGEANKLNLALFGLAVSKAHFLPFLGDRYSVADTVT